MTPTQRSRRNRRRIAPSPASGSLADYERFKQALERMQREEPENLIGITLIGMDLARARKALMGF